MGRPLLTQAIKNYYKNNDFIGEYTVLESEIDPILSQKVFTWLTYISLTFSCLFLMQPFPAFAENLKTKAKQKIHTLTDFNLPIDIPKVTKKMWKSMGKKHKLGGLSGQWIQDALIPKFFGANHGIQIEKFIEIPKQKSLYQFFSPIVEPKKENTLGFLKKIVLGTKISSVAWVVYCIANVLEKQDSDVKYTQPFNKPKSLFSFRGGFTKKPIAHAEYLIAGIFDLGKLNLGFKALQYAFHLVRGKDNKNNEKKNTSNEEFEWIKDQFNERKEENHQFNPFFILFKNSPALAIGLLGSLVYYMHLKNPAKVDNVANELYKILFPVKRISYSERLTNLSLYLVSKPRLLVLLGLGVYRKHIKLILNFF